MGEQAHGELVVVAGAGADLFSGVPDGFGGAVDGAVDGFGFEGADADLHGFVPGGGEGGGAGGGAQGIGAGAGEAAGFGSQRDAACGGEVGEEAGLARRRPAAAGAGFAVAGDGLEGGCGDEGGHGGLITYLVINVQMLVCAACGGPGLRAGGLACALGGLHRRHVSVKVF